jgi:hypothetical protein
MLSQDARSEAQPMGSRCVVSLKLRVIQRP